MAQHFWLSGQTLVDGNGTPYASAKAYFYETGTTTAKNTYSDAGLTSANANPVVADSNGRFGDIFLIAGRYKVVYKTSADVTIDTLDPVDGSVQMITASSAPSPAYPFMLYYNTTDGRRYRRNAANNAWIDEGPVDSLISGASVTEVLTGTATDKATTPDSVAGLWQRGTDIASASTLSLPSSGGGVFNVTGTTGISGISSAQGGRCIKLRFAGALTLTHNGTSFILPGAANITTVAGDVAEFINEAAADGSGSNWRCFNYQRSSGSPLNLTDHVATQAVMESASSTALAVTPGRQLFHPLHPKCLALFDGTGTPTASISQNLSSITDGGVGVYTMNWTTSFSSTNYCIVGGGKSSALNSSLCVSQNSTQSTTASAYPMTTRSASTDGVVDSSVVIVSAFGDF